MTNNRQSSNTPQPYVTNVLFLVLVAVTGFFVGSQYRSSESVSQPTVDLAPPEPNEVITQLQSALDEPPTSPNVIPTQTTVETTAIGLVNINTASISQLDTLPGIGPKYAQAIIDYRTQNGPFVRPEDIQQVRGIGPKTFEKIKDKITL